MATHFGLYPFLQKLYVYGPYQGPIFQATVPTILRQLDAGKVKRADTTNGFAVLPKRWLVQRSIAWLNRCRRLPNIGRASTERPSRSWILPPSAKTLPQYNRDEERRFIHWHAQHADRAK